MEYIDPDDPVDGLWNPEQESIAFKRWARSMSEGNFEDAWQINDSCKRHWPSAHSFYQRNDIRNADVLVRSLHGLGDTVQMLRYASRLRQLARSLTFEVPRDLLPLMPYFRGVTDETGAVYGHAAKRFSFDVTLELMELPYVFRTQLTQLPLVGNYLTLPHSLLADRANAMGPAKRKRVGVVWAGGDWDCERWVPLVLLKTLLDDGRFEWWNLQGGPKAADAATTFMRTTANLQHGGLLTLAATIANMDLVITIDTLAAHLAGAMGVPAWVMLKYNPDWRWMASRINSPWYPSVQLFRQAAPADWSGVISAIRQELQSVRADCGFKGCGSPEAAPMNTECMAAC